MEKPVVWGTGELSQKREVSKGVATLILIVAVAVIAVGGAALVFGLLVWLWHGINLILATIIAIVAGGILLAVIIIRGLTTFP